MAVFKQQVKLCNVNQCSNGLKYSNNSYLSYIIEGLRGRTERATSLTLFLPPLRYLGSACLGLYM